jgi:hypothetical protein
MDATTAARSATVNSPYSQSSPMPKPCNTSPVFSATVPLGSNSDAAATFSSVLAAAARYAAAAAGAGATTAPSNSE